MTKPGNIYLLSDESIHKKSKYGYKTNIVDLAAVRAATVAEKRQHAIDMLTENLKKAALERRSS